jgi:hypothetical protein
MIDHKDSLVGQNVRLGKVLLSLGIEEPVSVGEVLPVVGVFEVVNVLVLAKVVSVVDFGLIDCRFGQVELDEGLQHIGIEIMNPVFVDRTEIYKYLVTQIKI